MNTSKSWRTPVVLVALAVASTTLAACGGDDESSGGSGGEDTGAGQGPVEDPTEPTTVSFFSWVGNGPEWKKIAREFEKDHPNIKIKFENVPADTAETLAPLMPLRPGANALAISQDRLAEKSFIGGLGIPVAPHRAIRTAKDLAPALAELGGRGILKTTRLGYDGKGQRHVASLAEACSSGPKAKANLLPAGKPSNRRVPRPFRSDDARRRANCPRE